MLEHRTSTLMSQQWHCWNADRTFNHGVRLRDYGFTPGRSISREWLFETADSAVVSISDQELQYERDAGPSLLIRFPLNMTLHLPLRSEVIDDPNVVVDPLGDLLPPLLVWIGTYERWVLDTGTSPTRDETLMTYARPAIEPALVPGRFWTLASSWRAALESLKRKTRLGA